MHCLQQEINATLYYIIKNSFNDKSNFYCNVASKNNELDKCSATVYFATLISWGIKAMKRSVFSHLQCSTKTKKCHWCAFIFVLLTVCKLMVVNKITGIPYDIKQYNTVQLMH